MLNKSTLSLLVWASAASAFAQTAADIQARPDSSAYAQDARRVIVRSSFGLCWRTAYWNAADSVVGCDGELAPPVSKVTAPAIISTLVQTDPKLAALPLPAASIKRCNFAATLENDQIFKFGKTTMTVAAERHIDKAVLGRLKDCTKIELISITGHADRLGTVEFNQRLSEQRAEAVAAYIKSKGVSARVLTFGEGKNQPIKSCDVRFDRKKLIECLAPNRRVMVEVRGLE